ncbi:uncharacterized protein LOC120917168 [Rana temporaria]|uniref:uncharacterized protein LOC120917168 n=1 Tax=Rana temporaria TaxID=8407 RepID=UPI001AAD9F58|nr:uncharacterized protein LOC120917168 [Rana temporaria]
MGGRHVLILCVSLINAVLGSHMQGGSMSFRPREKYSNGWVVDFKYETAFTDPSYRFSWGCNSGNCGSEFQNTVIPMENRTSSPSHWYQDEGYMKRRVPIDKPFQLRESSCCWVYNVYTEGGWELLTAVDLGTRSDTKKPNSSPVTTIIPILRIPQNCATTITLLAHDPDGDLVTCQYGYYYGECGLCNHYFSVDQRRCIISFPSGMSTGSYVMEMVLEDFPNKNIHLTYYDRTVVYKNSPYHRKTREAPNKSDKYWYWDYTSVETLTDSYEFTDSVTDYPDYELLTTFTEDIQTPEYPEDTTQLTETSIDTTFFLLSEITEGTVTEAGTEDFEETTDVQEATHQFTTEDVAFPYETTGWDFYPTQQHETVTITDDPDLEVSSHLPETTVGPFAETTAQYFEETTDVQEATHQFTTEDVAFPYETTGWDFYPTQQHETVTITDHPDLEVSSHLPETTEGPFAETTAEYFEETTVVQEATHQISTEAVTIPYETTGWDFYTSVQQPIYTNSLSRIPLQFLVEATSPAPTCSFGEYRPRFLSPTPSHGTKLLVNAGRKFQLHLTAQAAYERISDFKVSGLPGMTKTFTSSSQSNTRSMVVEWTPKEDNVGEHVAVCFVAETTNGYQSELRCVVVVIGPSKLDTSLICHDNTMTLIIATSANDQLNNIQLRLNDPKCLVSSNNTHLIASVGYNSCGTVTEETEENIVFKNTATNHDMSSVITRQNGISIPFNCSFPKKNRVSASFRAHRSDFIFTEAGFGNFTYKIQFFTDSRFVEVNTQSPLEVILKELLYMEIQVSSSVPNIELFVESCKATPHDNPSDPIFYNIIENGCIKDNTVVVYPGSNTKYRFAMEAFGFIGDYPEVYMNCIVILCKTGAPNTRCTQGCVTNSMEASSRYRNRRSLISESQQHFISQGPMSMKRETVTDKGEEKTSALNVNTLVIALSVMATVGMISVTLNIYMKRVRTARYQRLHTQDF